MKKYTFNSIIVFIVMGSFFVACKKDTSKTTNETHFENSKKNTYRENFEFLSHFDYDSPSLIEDIRMNTLIDVDKLAMKDYVTTYVEEELIYALDCGDVGENFVYQLTQIAEKIEYFYIEEVYDSCLYYYELFTQLHNGFVSCFPQMRVEEYDYEDKSYKIPGNFVGEKREKCQLLEDKIIEDYPSYKNLGRMDKMQVLATTIYLNLNTNPNLLPPPGKLENCIKTANNSCFQSIAIASALYITGMALCSGTTFAVFICWGVAHTAYVSTCSDAMHTRKVAIENCNHRYGK